MRSVDDVAMDAISVHATEGDGTAVKVHLGHNINPSIKQQSVCLIDGDSQQKDNSEKLIYRLPGESPESYIYDKVVEKLPEKAGELAVSLSGIYEEHEKVVKIINSVQNTNRDPHLLYSQVGKQLKLIPENLVKYSFIKIWVRSFPDEVNSILDKFRDKIPLENTHLNLSKSLSS